MNSNSSILDSSFECRLAVRLVCVVLRVGRVRYGRCPTEPFVDLNVAKGRKGKAPNKPLLVLAILDLVEAGLVGPEGLVHKDAELNLRFRS